MKGSNISTSPLQSVSSRCCITDSLTFCPRYQQSGRTARSGISFRSYCRSKEVDSLIEFISLRFKFAGTLYLLHYHCVTSYTSVALCISQLSDQYKTDEPSLDSYQVLFFTCWYLSLCNNFEENSDWTAFAEAIREDIRQKKDRIRCLEEALGMKAEEFGRNPALTQRRLLQSPDTEAARRGGEQADRATFGPRGDQQKEILRLHGLLTVEEKGRVFRKMR
ncbi:uncharacterized protein CEXT_254631 [Caerostris extrusa]|uniref:Uncharacterized protein n=1 Tax=Caerostris extrusa TaxID=172846 RepID=A0AAV4NPV1_CAEEX|nr:uncharacterized protein CEXT_254631 [Caerostris extrusa]